MRVGSPTVDIDRDGLCSAFAKDEINNNPVDAEMDAHITPPFDKYN